MNTILSLLFKTKVYYLYLIIFLLLMTGFIFGQRFFKKEITSQKTILFLCVHNTFRSQIAEAYFNKFAKEKNLNWRAKSAGFLKAGKVNEKAVVLMAEEGIDISAQKPKLLTEEMLKEAEKIVVVCKDCEEELGLCLNLPKDKDIERWHLEDPAKMELDEAREIRNLIKEKIINLIETLE